MVRTIERVNGIFYTPDILADYLVEPLIDSGSKKIRLLDPAYGEGSLLLAAERKFNKKFKTSVGLELFGCDIKPVNGLLSHLPQANLRKTNFFDYEPDQKFSAILMNPPYVRHHRIKDSSLESIREKHDEVKILNNLADLWTYFVVKSLAHLEIGGGIAAILPWSFLQAEYAKPLRQLLHEKFDKISVLTLSGKYFAKAEERVILVWLTNFGSPCRDIQIGCAKKITDKITYSHITKEDWLAEKVDYTGGGKIRRLLSDCDFQYGFTELSDFTEIKIGVVTGADKHFIITPERAKEYGFKKRHLVPIINNGRQLPSVLLKGKEGLKVLVHLPRSDYRSYVKFVNDGKNSKYQNRAHSKRRDPWYAVRRSNFPDAFFPYRVSSVPFMILNSWKVQCTNSIHRLYFKGITKTQAKWLFVSLLSEMSQLSIESNSKTYGRGMLKIEPGSLEKTLVFIKNEKSVNAVYQEVLKAVKKNDRQLAVRLATKFIATEAGLKKDFLSEVSTELNTIQSLRSL